MIDKIGKVSHSAESHDVTGVTPPVTDIAKLELRLPKSQPSAVLTALPRSAVRCSARRPEPDCAEERPDTSDGDKKKTPASDSEDAAASGVRLPQPGGPPNPPRFVPPVAQGAEPPPPSRAAIYAAMKKLIDKKLQESGMVRLYDLLGAIDAEKLTLAIQAFEASQALRGQSGMSLAQVLLTNGRAVLPASKTLRQTDFLLQLKCWLFFPARSAKIDDDHALLKAIAALGLDDPDDKQSVVDIAMMIATAEQPYGLLKIKTMIDAESQGQGAEMVEKGPDESVAGIAVSTFPENVRFYVNMPLLPQDKKLIVDKLQSLVGAKLGRAALERLCDALAVVDNTKMIEVAVRACQASLALQETRSESLTSFLRSRPSDDMIAWALAIAFQRTKPLRRTELEDVVEAVMTIKHWYCPSREAIVKLEADDLFLLDLVMLAQDPRFLEPDSEAIINAMRRLENPFLVCEIQSMVKWAMRLNTRGSTLASLESLNPAERDVLIQATGEPSAFLLHALGIHSPPDHPPVMQSAPSPLGESEEYDRIRTQLGIHLPDDKVELLCYSLSIIDAPKLELALQVFDASVALQMYGGHSLMESLFRDTPLHLLEGRRPIRKDLLLQLKCLFFYPTWADPIEDDISLMNEIIRLGLDDSKNDDLILDVSLAIRLAERPYALLGVKNSIDAERQAGVPAGSSPAPGEPLSPGDRHLVVANLGGLAGSVWLPADLERLCHALCAVGNMGLIELATGIHLVSTILEAHSSQSFVDILSSRISDALAAHSIESVLEKNTQLGHRAIQEIIGMVALVRHWYLPLVGGATSLTTDDALLKDIVALAQDTSFQDARPDVIIDAMRHPDGLAFMKRLKLQIRWAMRIKKRGISLDELFARNSLERLKFMKEKDIEF